MKITRKDDYKQFKNEFSNAYLKKLSRDLRACVVAVFHLGPNLEETNILREKHFANKEKHKYKCISSSHYNPKIYDYLCEDGYNNNIIMKCDCRKEINIRYKDEDNIEDNKRKLYDKKDNKMIYEIYDKEDTNKRFIEWLVI